MIPCSCPECGYRYKVADDLAGTNVLCPECQTRFKVKGKPPAESRRAEEGRDDDDDRRRRDRDRDDDEEDDERPRQEDEDEDRHQRGSRRYVQQGGAASRSLGQTSLLLGLMAIIVSLLPCIGVVGIPLGGLGLVLGIAGLVVALVRKAKDFGYPIAGSVANLGAIMVALFWAVLWDRAFDGHGKNKPLPAEVAVSRPAPAVNAPQAGRDAGPPIPPDQAEFVDLINGFAGRYRQAANQIQKTELRFERSATLKRFNSNHVAPANWVGTLRELQTDRDGTVTLVIAVAGSNGLSVGTWNNDFSDVRDKTRIARGSQLYTALSQLTEGQQVVFSGWLFPDDSNQDFLHEMSLTEEGSMKEPEFLMRFADIKRK